MSGYNEMVKRELANAKRVIENQKHFSRALVKLAVRVVLKHG